jgi:two-component system chemotaxis response regulator CheY
MPRPLFSLGLGLSPSTGSGKPLIVIHLVGSILWVRYRAAFISCCIVDAQPTNLSDAQALGETQSFRILVIDDNPGDRELAVRHIRRAWPFEYELHIEKAVDGEEAMAKLAEDAFTAIVLDWQLPRLSGVDVLRALRSKGVNVPVIVVSGLSREEITEDLESFGAVYLGKEAINPTSLRDAMAASARWLADQSMRSKTANLAP